MHHRGVGHDVRKANAIATVKAVAASPPLLLLVAIIGLFSGLAIVIGHNFWSGGVLPVFVTGCLMTIRGDLLLSLSPETVKRLLLKPFAMTSCSISTRL